jgi:hypothetical protein
MLGEELSSRMFPFDALSTLADLFSSTAKFIAALKLVDWG